MVRDALISSSELIDLAFKFLPMETETVLQKSVFEFLSMAVSAFTPRHYVKPLCKKLFKMVQSLL
jgi:hypothetical protein